MTRTAPAAIAALCVLAALALIDVVRSALTFAQVGALGYPGAGDAWASQGVSLATGPLLLAVGVFVAFRLFRPTTAADPLGRVVIRALWATAAGALVVWIVAAGIQLALVADDRISDGRPLIEIIGPTLLSTFAGAVGTAVGALPLVLLAALLLREWTRAREV